MPKIKANYSFYDAILKYVMLFFAMSLVILFVIVHRLVQRALELFILCHFRFGIVIFGFSSSKGLLSNNSPPTKNVLQNNY